MDTLLAIAEVFVAVELIAIGIAVAIALVAAPIVVVAYCMKKWRRRLKLLAPFTTSPSSGNDLSIAERARS